jgi:hypothetical protein
MRVLDYMVCGIFFIVRLNECEAEIFFQRLNALEQFFFAHIFLVELIVCRIKIGNMHLPDPITFTFGTAIVNLAIAITAVIRLILEKKNHSKNDTSDKNETKGSKKTDRWLELGRATNRLTHTSVAFFKKPSVAQRLKQVLSQKKSEIVPSGQFLSGSYVLRTAVKPASSIGIWFTHPDNDHVIIGEFKYFI